RQAAAPKLAPRSESWTVALLASSHRASVIGPRRRGPSPLRRSRAPSRAEPPAYRRGADGVPKADRSTSRERRCPRSSRDVRSADASGDDGPRRSEAHHKEATDVRYARDVAHRSGTTRSAGAQAPSAPQVTR